MKAPADIDELVQEITQRGDAYLALPVYGATTSASVRAALDELLLSRERFKLAFAALPFTPPGFLKRLAEEKRPAVAQRLARNPGSGAETLTRLLRRTNDPAQRAAIAGHRNTRAELLAELCDEADKRIRAALLRNLNTPRKALHFLFADATPEELALLARHPQADEGLLRVIWEQDAAGAPARSEILSHATCPPDLLHSAVRDGDADARRSCASNPTLPQEELLRLLVDPDSGVRAEALRAAAGVEDAPIEGDEAVSVRRIQARRQRLPEDLAAQLARDVDVWVRTWLARNPTLPTTLIGALSRDPEPAVRHAAGRNTSCAPHDLTVLATDADDWVRAGIACRPDLPEAALHRLEDDGAVDVAAAIARNPRTRIDALMRLAVHPEADVRRSVALNPAAEVQALRALLDDPYPLNRAMAIRHPNLPDDDVWRLAEDPEPQVRFAVGKRAADRVTATGARAVS